MMYVSFFFGGGQGIWVGWLVSWEEGGECWSERLRNRIRISSYRYRKVERWEIEVGMYVIGGYR